VQELDEFALQPGEFEEIEEEHQRLANGTELMQECGYCLDLLYDNEETTIAGLLQTAVDRAETLVGMDSRLGNVLGMLNEALIGVQESHSELRSYLDRLELDPERFNELESRLQGHQPGTQAPCQTGGAGPLPSELAADLARLNSDEERLEGMEDELASARQAFVQAAEALSQSRQRYAEELGAKVSASMHELAMPDGRFAIEVRPDAQSSPRPLASIGWSSWSPPTRVSPSNPLARWLPAASCRVSASPSW
jgi:DNA repair protein RecN (Recombination protein N)